MSGKKFILSWTINLWWMNQVHQASGVAGQVRQTLAGKDSHSKKPKKVRWHIWSKFSLKMGSATSNWPINDLCFNFLFTCQSNFSITCQLACPSSLVNKMCNSLVSQLVHHHLSIKCFRHWSKEQKLNEWDSIFSPAFSMRLELKSDYVSHCDWIMNSGHFGIYEPQPVQKLECTPQILAAIFYCMDSRTQGLEVYGR